MHCINLIVQTFLTFLECSGQSRQSIVKARQYFCVIIDARWTLTLHEAVLILAYIGHRVIYSLVVCSKPSSHLTNAQLCAIQHALVWCRLGSSPVVKAWTTYLCLLKWIKHQKGHYPFWCLFHFRRQLHILSFFQYEMVQVVEVLPCGRQGP